MRPASNHGLGWTIVSILNGIIREDLPGKRQSPQTGPVKEETQSDNNDGLEEAGKES